MADWSLAQPLPDVMGNALNAFQQGRETATSRRAGQALASGDTNGAAALYFGQGMNDQGIAVQDRQRTMQRQDLQDQRQQSQFDAETAERLRGEVLREAMAIRMAPQDQWTSMYQQRGVPLLQKIGVPQADIDRVLLDGKLTPDELDSFIVQMGGEPPKRQVLNFGGGGVGEYDPYGRDPESRYRVLREPTQQKAPAGYEWDENGDLAYIPGGPADPRFAGQLAGSKRAPRVGGRSGGGRRGGGAVPALPPGFVMEK